MKWSYLQSIKVKLFIQVNFLVSLIILVLAGFPDIRIDSVPLSSAANFNAGSMRW